MNEPRSITGKPGTEGFAIKQANRSSEAREQEAPATELLRART